MNDKKIIHCLKIFLESKYLSVFLAVLAATIMLGCLNDGLFMDDLIQRTALVDSSQIPQQLYSMGIVPDHPGRLSTALFNTFGFVRGKKYLKQAKDCGLVPWWTSENFKAALFRPVTAFTHWLDYRMFPENPAFMHAHNILWFAAVVFLVSVLYRKIIGPVWVSGFAALLFLIDENSYFPVSFVANRGFFISMCFAELAVLVHHKWRKHKVPFYALISSIMLLLSLLANEAGVTTFAYILAYELVLDKTTLKNRLFCLIPSIVTILIWRIIYNALDYGVYGCGLYIDPLNEPFLFIVSTIKRIPLLLFGQLFFAMDLIHAASDLTKIRIILFSVVAVFIVLFIFLPLIQKNTIARFFFAAMLFSVIPLATVEPMSKNLPFLAIAAFGLLAVFIASILQKDSTLPNTQFWKVPAYILCVTFLITNIPLPVANRLLAQKITKFFVGSISACRLNIPEKMRDKHIIVVNAPSAFSIILPPFEYVYHNKPVPKSLRALVPSFRAIQLTRIDDKTLIIKTENGNLFKPAQHSPLHFVYLFERFNIFRGSHLAFKQNETVSLSLLTVEVLHIDDTGQPNEIRCTFNIPLEDKSLYWLEFDWRKFSYSKFTLPSIGQSIKILGPPPVSFKQSINRIMQSISKNTSAFKINQPFTTDGEKTKILERFLNDEILIRKIKWKITDGVRLKGRERAVFEFV